MKLKVKVKPNSSQQKIEKVDKENYIAYLNSPPQKGKANQQLLKLLKKHFKKQPTIIKGKTSKNKIIEI